MFNICGHWQFCKKYLSFDLILLLIWRDNGSDGTTRVRLGTKIMQELKFRIWYWSAYLNQVSLFPDTYVLNLKIYKIEHFQTWSPHLGFWQLEQRIKTNNFQFTKTLDHASLFTDLRLFFCTKNPWGQNSKIRHVSNFNLVGLPL